MRTQSEDNGFETYMDQVNAYLNRLCGMSAYDLPDWCYRDAYDDHMTPRAAAREAYRAAREG